MSDLPGSLRNFAAIVADCRANIITVQHDRLSTGIGLNDTILHVVCEVSGVEHGDELFRMLEAAGYEITRER
jgi:threonine dehydratase